MNDADTSQKVEAKKLELVTALTQLVDPLDQILGMQRSTARRFSVASVVVALVVCAMAAREYYGYTHDQIMHDRLEAVAGQLERLEKRPTIAIRPAPASDPTASPTLIIQPPPLPAAPLSAPSPNGHRPPPPPAAVEIPLDLPGRY